MMKRIAITLLSFVATACLVSIFCAMRSNAVGGVPRALTTFDALFGVGVGLLAARLAWKSPAPDVSDTSKNAAAMLGLVGRKLPDTPNRSARIRNILQFALLLVVGMVLTSAWIDPHNGGFRMTPSIANFVPGLLIAGFASALMKRDARRKSGAPDRWQTYGLEKAAGRFARSAASKAGNVATGGLGTALSTSGSSARGFRRMFGAFRSGGAAAAGQPDWGILAPLFAAGCLFFAIGLTRDAGPAMLIAGLAFGGAAAVSYDHDVSRVLRLARMPSLRDLALFGLCTLPMLWLAVAIEMAAAPALIDHPTPLTIGLTAAGKVLAAIGQLLVATPLLAALVRSAPEDERPLWPLLAGFVGGEIALLVLTVQWNAAIESAFQFYPGDAHRDWRADAANAVAFPPLGLLLGAGLATWFQALTAHRRAAFDWERVFPASIKGCMALMTVALVGSIITQTAPTQSWRIGQAEAGMVTCLVWLYVLWRIDAMRPASALRALSGWAAITVLFYFSALAAYLTGAGNDWAGLLLIITVPIAIASWVLTVALVPGFIRRVLGDD